MQSDKWQPLGGEAVPKGKIESFIRLRREEKEEGKLVINFHVVFDAGA